MIQQLELRCLDDGIELPREGIRAMILKVPGIVRGEIFPPSARDMLTQDMLQVELSSGIILDVGWYPEHDAHGRYVIIAFFKDDPGTLIKEILASDSAEAHSIVTQLASYFSRPARNVSSSGERTLAVTYA